MAQTTVHLRCTPAGQPFGSTCPSLPHAADLRKAGGSEKRITGVATWQDALYRTPVERAALAVPAAVLTPAVHGERVPGALYRD